MKPEVARISDSKLHKGAVYALEKGHADGSFFSAGSDGLVIHQHIDGPEPAAVANAGIPVYALLFRAETRHLLVGTGSGNIHIIDLEAKKEIRNLQAGNKALFSMRLSPQKNMIAAGCGDGNVMIYDASDYRAIVTLPSSKERIRTLAFHPSGNALAAGGSDGRIRIYRTADFSLMHEFEAHSPSVFSIAYSSDGSKLFSGGRDARLKAFDSLSMYGKTLDIVPHMFTVNAIAMDKNGNLLATASRDKSIRLWNAMDASLLRTMDSSRSGGHTHSVNALAWITENTMISGGDDGRTIAWKTVYNANS
jgi:WD40 repeat protein